MAQLNQESFSKLPRARAIKIFVAGADDTSQFKLELGGLINNVINHHAMRRGFFFEVWMSELYLHGGFSIPPNAHPDDRFLDQLKASYFVIFVVNCRVGPGTRREVQTTKDMVASSNLKQEFISVMLNHHHDAVADVVWFKDQVKTIVDYVYYADPKVAPYPSFTELSNGSFQSWFHDKINVVSQGTTPVPFRRKIARAFTETIKMFSPPKGA